MWAELPRLTWLHSMPTIEHCHRLIRPHGVGFTLTLFTRCPFPLRSVLLSQRALRVTTWSWI